MRREKTLFASEYTAWQLSLQPVAVPSTGFVNYSYVDVVDHHCGRCFLRSHSNLSDMLANGA